MNTQLDIVVIGDDEASLAAAAAAARAGARTGIVNTNQARLGERRKKNTAATSSAIPNFVWRRLDLQDYDLVVEPVSARVTLFKDGDPLTTYASTRESALVLATRGGDDHLLWRDFVGEAGLLGDEGYLCEAQLNAGAPGGKSFAALLRDPIALGRAARLFGPCAALLDDYFTDPQLKAHLSAHALAPNGRGDRESGSAAAVAEFFDENAWRVRAPKDGRSILSVLETVCQDSGVQHFAGKITAVGPVNGKHVAISIGAEEKIRARHIFFASPDAAIEAGAIQAGGANTHRGAERADHATFTVRFKLAEPLTPPGGDARAVFQIVDDGGDLQLARDAAVKGQFTDKLPVEFEITPNGEIIAHSAYFPAAFYEDGAWRGWTGQDRQAAAALIRERLVSRMPGLAALIRRTETEMIAPSSSPSPFVGCDRVIIQSRRHNAISAAVMLIDKVMASDE